MKRVFKFKSFSRWAKNVVDDHELCLAAREVEMGLFEADLGGGVYKKRVAMPGQGKSGSVRTLIAMRHEESIFFLVGRKKSDPVPDFTADEIQMAKFTANGLGRLTATELSVMLRNGTIKEICYEH